MTADVAAGLVKARLADRYRRFRSPHPVHVLRWLRNGMLLSLAAAALLYLWVVMQAGGDITAAQRTQQAVMDLNNASIAVTAAESELNYTFSHEDVTLVGTGSAFVNQITTVNKFLTLAAEDNAAGAEGKSEIQLVENQLTSYLQQSETAVSDNSNGPLLSKAGQSYADSAAGDLTSAIGMLSDAEKAALSGQRATWALRPEKFSWALLGPVVGMLALFVGTVNLLARHFRRTVSPLLWGALAITTLTMATVEAFNATDAQSLAATPWAGSPVTIAAVLLLLLTAAVLAARAYQPRLAEYWFEPS